MPQPQLETDLEGWEITPASGGSEDWEITPGAQDTSGWKIEKAGSTPENSLREQHPDLSTYDRERIQNLTGGRPKTAIKNLENMGFEAKQIGNWDFALKKRDDPGGRWYRLEGGSEPVKDVMDVIGGGGQMIGQGIGATAGMALGGGPTNPVGSWLAATGGAGLVGGIVEAGLMGLGKLTGLEYPLEEALKAVGTEAALGAGAQGVLSAVGGGLRMLRGKSFFPAGKSLAPRGLPSLLKEMPEAAEVLEKKAWFKPGGVVGEAAPQAAEQAGKILPEELQGALREVGEGLKPPKLGRAAGELWEFIPGLPERLPKAPARQALVKEIARAAEVMRESAAKNAKPYHEVVPLTADTVREIMNKAATHTSPQGVEYKQLQFKALTARGYRKGQGEWIGGTRGGTLEAQATHPGRKPGGLSYVGKDLKGKATGDLIKIAKKAIQTEKNIPKYAQELFFNAISGGTEKSKRKAAVRLLVWAQPLYTPGALKKQDSLGAGIIKFAERLITRPDSEGFLRARYRSGKIHRFTEARFQDEGGAWHYILFSNAPKLKPTALQEKALGLGLPRVQAGPITKTPASALPPQGWQEAAGLAAERWGTKAYQYGQRRRPFQGTLPGIGYVEGQKQNFGLNLPLSSYGLARGMAKMAFGPGAPATGAALGGYAGYRKGGIKGAALGAVAGSAAGFGAREILKAMAYPSGKALSKLGSVLAKDNGQLLAKFLDKAPQHLKPIIQRTLRAKMEGPLSSKAKAATYVLLHQPDIQNWLLSLTSEP